MADQRLQSIVQKMVEAGEPEDAIAAVISSYNPNEMSIEDKRAQRAKLDAAAGGTPMAGSGTDYTGKQIDTSKETSNPLWAGITRGDAAMNAGATGFGKGFIKAPLRLAQGFGSMVMNAPGYIADIIADPKGNVQRAKEGLSDIPGAARKTFDSAIDLARTDPEAFGEESGSLVGQAVTAAAIPQFPAIKGAPAVIGKTAEKIGKAAQWPLRISGAHQLGEGNPMGLATMAAPEILQTGGKMLRMATSAKIPVGEPLTTYHKTFNDALVNELQAMIPEARVTQFESAVQRAHRTAANARGWRAEGELKESAKEIKADVSGVKNEIVANAGKMKAAPKAAEAEKRATEKQWEQEGKNETAREKFLRKQQEQDARNADAKREYERKVEQDRAAADAESAARERDSRAQLFIDRLKTEAGLQAQPPVVTETVKAPGATATTRYTTSTDVTPENAAGSGARPTGDPVIEKFIKEGGYTGAAADAIRAQAPGGQGTVAGPGTASQTVAPVETPVVPTDAPATTPSAFEQSLRDSLAQRGGPVTEARPAYEPSRTTREMSPVKGLSTNDIQVLEGILGRPAAEIIEGLNNGTIKLSGENIRPMEGRRGARGSTYKTNAGLDKGGSTAAKREK